MKHDHPPVLICVDWGSTNFRAFLLDARGEVLDRISSEQGMLTLNQNQFEPALMQQITPWLEAGPLPALMAGMVGSQQGWYDAGYAGCSASLSSLVKKLYWVPNPANLKLAIVPGIKGQSISGQPDVMRGEEVQIFGALLLLEQTLSELQDQALICLPGMHCKWARIDKASQEQARVLDFSTQMTGELYSLLGKHSILVRMGKIEDATPTVNIEVFDQGIACSRGNGGLLHHLFSARTQVLAESIDDVKVNAEAYVAAYRQSTE